MKPSTRLSPGFETSTIATVLLSALATSKLSGRPARARARSASTPAALPERARSRSARCAFGRATSTTQTAFVFAQATNSRVPSAESTIAFGCSPTATLALRRERRRVEHQHASRRPRARRRASCRPARADTCTARPAASPSPRPRRSRGRPTLTQFAEHVDGVEPRAVRADGDAADETLLRASAGRVWPAPQRRHVLATRRSSLPARQLLIRPRRVPARCSTPRPTNTAACRPDATPGPATRRRAARPTATFAMVEIHDAQRRLRVAVVGDDERVAVGRERHRERQIADRHVTARGLNPPAVRQERDAAAERTRQRRWRRRLPRDGDGRGRHHDERRQSERKNRFSAHPGTLPRTRKNDVRKRGGHRRRGGVFGKTALPASLTISTSSCTAACVATAPKGKVRTSFVITTPAASERSGVARKSALPAIGMTM